MTSFVVESAGRRPSPCAPPEPWADNRAEPHEALLLREEERRRLEGALARLPEKYRLPLMLYYFDGHSTRNVAKMLDLDPAGVLTRLSRAQRELRRMLQEQGGAQ